MKFTVLVVVCIGMLVCSAFGQSSTNTICTPNATWQPYTDLTTLMECVMVADNSVVETIMNETTLRKCACREALVEIDNVTSMARCVSKTQDCGTMSCTRKHRNTEIELMGPYLQNPAPECVAARQDVISMYLSNASSQCYYQQCNNLKTATCYQNALFDACNSSGNVYAYWYYGGTKDVIPTSVAAIPTSMNFTLFTANNVKYNAFRAAMANVLNVDLSDMVPLLPGNGWLVIMQSGPYLSRMEILSKLYAEKTVLKKYVQLPAPSWCSTYSFDNNQAAACLSNQSSYNTAVTSCTASYCQCLGYVGTLDVCPIPYGTTSDDASKCLQLREQCLVQNAFVLLNTSAGCEASYATQRNIETVKQRCMSDACSSDAAQYFTNDTLSGWCSVAAAMSVTVPLYPAPTKSSVCLNTSLPVPDRLNPLSCALDDYTNAIKLDTVCSESLCLCRGNTPSYGSDNAFTCVPDNGGDCGTLNCTVIRLACRMELFSRYTQFPPYNTKTECVQLAAGFSSMSQEDCYATSCSFKKTQNCLVDRYVDGCSGMNALPYLYNAALKNDNTTVAVFPAASQVAMLNSNDFAAMKAVVAETLRLPITSFIVLRLSTETFSVAVTDKYSALYNQPSNVYAALMSNSSFVSGYVQNPTSAPTTQAPTTQAPTTQAPTTLAPTTQAPTDAPTTQAPTTQAPTDVPTPAPINNTICKNSSLPVPNNYDIGSCVSSVDGKLDRLVAGNSICQAKKCACRGGTAVFTSGTYDRCDSSKADCGTISCTQSDYACLAETFSTYFARNTSQCTSLLTTFSTLSLSNCYADECAKNRTDDCADTEYVKGCQEFPYLGNVVSDAASGNDVNVVSFPTYQETVSQSDQDFAAMKSLAASILGIPSSEFVILKVRFGYFSVGIVSSKSVLFGKLGDVKTALLGNSTFVGLYIAVTSNPVTTPSPTGAAPTSAPTPVPTIPANTSAPTGTPVQTSPVTTAAPATDTPVPTIPPANTSAPTGTPVQTSPVTTAAPTTDTPTSDPSTPATTPASTPTSTPAPPQNTVCSNTSLARIDITNLLTCALVANMDTYSSKNDQCSMQLCECRGGGSILTQNKTFDRCIGEARDCGTMDCTQRYFSCLTEMFSPYMTQNSSAYCVSAWNQFTSFTSFDCYGEECLRNRTKDCEQDKYIAACDDFSTISSVLKDANTLSSTQLTTTFQTYSSVNASTDVQQFGLLKSMVASILGIPTYDFIIVFPISGYVSIGVTEGGSVWYNRADEVQWILLRNTTFAQTYVQQTLQPATMPPTTAPTPNVSTVCSQYGTPVSGEDTSDDRVGALVGCAMNVYDISYFTARVDACKIKRCSCRAGESAFGQDGSLVDCLNSKKDCGTLSCMSAYSGCLVEVFSQLLGNADPACQSAFGMFTNLTVEKCYTEECQTTDTTDCDNTRYQEACGVFPVISDILLSSSANATVVGQNVATFNAYAETMNLTLSEFNDMKSLVGSILNLESTGFLILMTQNGFVSVGVTEQTSMYYKRSDLVSSALLANTTFTTWYVVAPTNAPASTFCANPENFGPALPSEPTTLKFANEIVLPCMLDEDMDMFVTLHSACSSAECGCRSGVVIADSTGNFASCSFDSHDCGLMNCTRAHLQCLTELFGPYAGASPSAACKTLDQGFRGLDPRYCNRMECDKQTTDQCESSRYAEACGPVGALSQAYTDAADGNLKTPTVYRTYDWVMKMSFTEFSYMKGNVSALLKLPEQSVTIVRANGFLKVDVLDSKSPLFNQPKTIAFMLTDQRFLKYVNGASVTPTSPAPTQATWCSSLPKLPTVSVPKCKASPSGAWNMYRDVAASTCEPIKANRTTCTAANWDSCYVSYERCMFQKAYPKLLSAAQADACNDQYSVETDFHIVYHRCMAFACSVGIAAPQSSVASTCSNVAAESISFCRQQANDVCPKIGEEVLDATFDIGKKLDDCAKSNGYNVDTSLCYQNACACVQGKYVPGLSANPAECCQAELSYCGTMNCSRYLTTCLVEKFAPYFTALRTTSTCSALVPLFGNYTTQTCVSNACSDEEDRFCSNSNINGACSNVDSKIIATLLNPQAGAVLTTSLGAFGLEDSEFLELKTNISVTLNVKLEELFVMIPQDSQLVVAVVNPIPADPKRDVVAFTPQDVFTVLSKTNLPYVSNGTQPKAPWCSKVPTAIDRTAEGCVMNEEQYRQELKGCREQAYKTLGWGSSVATLGVPLNQCSSMYPRYMRVNHQCMLDILPKYFNNSTPCIPGWRDKTQNNTNSYYLCLNHVCLDGEHDTDCTEQEQEFACQYASAQTPGVITSRPTLAPVTQAPKALPAGLVRYEQDILPCLQAGLYAVVEKNSQRQRLVCEASATGVTFETCVAQDRLPIESALRCVIEDIQRRVEMAPVLLNSNGKTFSGRQCTLQALQQFISSGEDLQDICEGIAGSDSALESTTVSKRQVECARTAELAAMYSGGRSYVMLRTLTPELWSLNKLSDLKSNLSTLINVDPSSIVVFLKDASSAAIVLWGDAIPLNTTNKTVITDPTAISAIIQSTPVFMAAYNVNTTSVVAGTNAPITPMGNDSAKAVVLAVEVIIGIAVGGGVILCLVCYIMGKKAVEKGWVLGDKELMMISPEQLLSSEEQDSLNKV